MLLAHNLASPDETSELERLQKTFEQYVCIRKAHVEKILSVGNRGGDASRDMDVVVEYTLYAFLWVMCECCPFREVGTGLV